MENIGQIVLAVMIGAMIHYGVQRLMGKNWETMPSMSPMASSQTMPSMSAMAPTLASIAENVKMRLLTMTVAMDGKHVSLVYHKRKDLMREYLLDEHQVFLREYGHMSDLVLVWKSLCTLAYLKAWGEIIRLICEPQQSYWGHNGISSGLIINEVFQNIKVGLETCLVIHDIGSSDWDHMSSPIFYWAVHMEHEVAAQMALINGDPDKNNEVEEWLLGLPMNETINAIYAPL